MIIDDLVNKLIGMGMDLGTKDAVTAALQFIGADTSTIDAVYIELKNKFNRKAFSKTAHNERVVFLPQCLRHSKDCQAKLTDIGYVCEECGSCSIFRIKKEAERLGYKVYIVPGGSMVHKILKNSRPGGCVGVACYFELEDATEKLTIAGIPYRAIPLLKDGCKDTVVDIEKVLRAIRS